MTFKALVYVTPLGTEQENLAASLALTKPLPDFIFDRCMRQSAHIFYIRYCEEILWFDSTLRMVSANISATDNCLTFGQLFW